MKIRVHSSKSSAEKRKITGRKQRKNKKGKEKASRGKKRKKREEN